MAWVEGKWQTWTPVISQPGTITHTLTYARYSIIGNTAVVQMRASITGTGTTANNVVVSGWPSAINPSNNANVATCGVFHFYDNSAATNFIGACSHQSSTTMQFMGWNQAGFFGSAVAIGNADLFSFMCTYEIA